MDSPLITRAGQAVSHSNLLLAGKARELDARAVSPFWDVAGVVFTAVTSLVTPAPSSPRDRFRRSIEFS
ncbi:MAG: hypothetical protein ACRDRR_07535 [Pseudonocardiaceae bacterium]